MRKKFLAILCSLAMTVSMLPSNGLGISQIQGAVLAPSGIEFSVNGENDVITWQAVTGAAAYNVYKADGRFGTYGLVGTTSDTSYEEVSEDGAYYKVAAVVDGVETEKSQPISKEISMFGKNVIIYSPNDSVEEIQKEVDNIYSQQEEAQFDEERYAIMFKKGTYADSLKVNVGFYTQVAGLGSSPVDTQIGGLEVSANWLWANNGETKNATQNFWRSVENLTVNSNVMWAVSQATSFRRMNIKGSVTLVDNGSWASGGYISDTYISSTLDLSSQQQWFNRNTQASSFSGTAWNLVDVGCVGDSNRVNDTGTVQNTIVSQTPESAERPYLVCDDNNEYSVFVPAYQENTSGVSWLNSTTEGKSIPISDFYIAKPDTDTADTINNALKEGKNLLLTPGIYRLDKAIEIENPDTVVLGLGYATLEPVNGTEAMNIADVDGVRVAGLLFEAGTENSDTLLKAGQDNTADHSANPTILSDLFFRVGGANPTESVSCDTCVQINSNDVIGDNFWVWRADHGWDASVGWDENVCYNGLVVNGDNVTIYALMVEHFEEYQTVWNGNGGRTYFYQSEMPYDVPSAEAYMSHNGTVEGWASYKVSDNVTTHEAYGLGMYAFYTAAAIQQECTVEVPNVPGVKVTNALSHNLSSNGEVKHVINNVGASTRTDYCPTVKIYNNNYVDEVKITPASGTYHNGQPVTIACKTDGADIYYTTDGSEPSKTNGTLYTGAFNVAESTIVKAKAFFGDMSAAADEADIKIVGNDETNILLGKNVTASTVKGGSGNLAVNAIDGDSSTRWESEWEDNQWLKVDLGGMYTITGFKINWDWAAAKAYKVQVSADGVNWSNVYAKTSGGNSAKVSYTFKNAKSARYIRIYCTERVSEYGNSIADFEAYGTAEDNVLYADQPDTLKIDGVNENNVTLTWRNAVGAVSYNIYRATGATNGSLIKMNTEPVTENTYTDKVNILNADKYVYKVTAVSSTGYESALSDSVVLSTRDNYGESAFDYSLSANTTQDPEVPDPGEENVVDDEEELETGGNNSPVTEAEGRHEAEDADLVGDGNIATVEAGSWHNFSGLSYVENLNGNDVNNISKYISFRVNVTKPGKYKATVAYTGSNTRFGIRVDNGSWQLVDTEATKDWCTTKTVEVEISLKSGINTINVSGATGSEWLCLDYVDLEFVRAEEVVTTEKTTEQETTTRSVTPTKTDVTTTNTDNTAAVQKPGKVKISKIKRNGKKAKITLKKVKGATKYQIRYSTTKKFKKVKKITSKKLKVTVKKLSRNKTYYFKARAVKVVGGKKYCGKWSKVKKLKKIK